MGFEYGFWEHFAHKRGTSMRKVTKPFGNKRRSIYMWLDGVENRLGRENQQALAGQFGVSLRTLLRVRSEYLTGKGEQP